MIFFLLSLVLVHITTVWSARVWKMTFHHSSPEEGIGDFHLRDLSQSFVKCNSVKIVLFTGIWVYFNITIFKSYNEEKCDHKQYWNIVLYGLNNFLYIFGFYFDSFELNVTHLTVTLQSLKNLVHEFITFPGSGILC